MDDHDFMNGWARADGKCLCLLISLFSGVLAVSAFGSGDPLADAAAILAASLASLASVAMALVSLADTSKPLSEG